MRAHYLEVEKVTQNLSLAGDASAREQLEQLHLKCPVIAEILDVNTRTTIEENGSLTALADFLVVNDLASRLIASIAVSRKVQPVFHEVI